MTTKKNDGGLAGVDPNREQFEPKDSDAVRQRHRMGAYGIETGSDRLSGGPWKTRRQGRKR